MSKPSIRIVLLLLAAALPACRPGGTGAPPPSPQPSPAPAPAQPQGRWVRAEKKTLVRSKTVTGSLAAARTTLVSPRVAGRITSILVDVGDKVAATQEVVRFDSTLAKIEVDQKKADLAIEKTALDDAVLNFERMDKLWNKPEGQQPSIPRKVFDEAKSKKEAAAARVDQAEQALKLAQANLDEATLRAPFDGVVTLRKLDPGAWVAIGEGVLEIRETSKLDLEFSLPQGDLSSVAVGTKVAFEMEGVEGGARTAEVSAIVPALAESTRSFTCRATVDNASGRLLPGILARVTVTLPSSPAVVLPAAAVTSTPGGAEVQARGEGGAAAARKVRAGEPWGDEVPILEGLSEGDEVFIPGPPPEAPR